MGVWVTKGDSSRDQECSSCPFCFHGVLPFFLLEMTASMLKAKDQLGCKNLMTQRQEGCFSQERRRALKRGTGSGHLFKRRLLEPLWEGKTASQLHCCDLMDLVFYFAVLTWIPRILRYTVLTPDPKAHGFFLESWERYRGLWLCVNLAKKSDVCIFPQVL